MSDSSEDYCSVQHAIDEIARGGMVILVDDPDREDEGDLTVATEKLTSEQLKFMTRFGRGLPCVTLTRESGKRLGLEYQVRQNNSAFRTPFSFSLDHRDVGERGVQVDSRVQTMRRLVEADATPDEFMSPGHVFPLLAHPAGVLGRQGQTEGSVDLARLAGLKPSGVICEVMAEDGTMLRGEALSDFAKKHGLPITSIAEMIRYRLSNEVSVREVSRSFVQTRFGEFQIIAFQEDTSGKEHLAFVKTGASDASLAPLCRIHSECLTGDVFGSRRCDCGTQLNHALEQIEREKSGVLLYLRQEGRGIGLLNKLRAYELQDGGLDTVEANLELGFEADERDFFVAARILKLLGKNEVRLMTNNPRKLDALESSGITVSERRPIASAIDEHNRSYLETKRDKLGHLF